MTQLEHNKISPNKVIISTGLALFAMFFGAGNIIFPLYLGANAGQHILANTLGFLITGVGVPMLGLIATSMFQGDYWAFFNRLGKTPAFLIITFLIIIIGPLGAIPRVETLIFNTLEPYLYEPLKNNAWFSLIFCSTVFILAYKETKLVDILGLFFSPIKIISFSTLIFVGMLYLKEPVITNSLTCIEAFKEAFIQGYSTMDLLATFFFCTVAFKSIEQHKNNLTIANPNLTSMIVKSSLLGAALISVIYLGFMFTAYSHTESLQGIGAEHMVKVISNVVLGKFGGLFVCITVAFACFATALALTEVSSNYLHKVVFKQKIKKVICLIIVTIITYCTSNLGFKTIMYYMVPVLEIVYPALITLSIMNILYKWKNIKIVKIPVFLTAGLFLLIKIGIN